MLCSSWSSPACSGGAHRVQVPGSPGAPCCLPQATRRARLPSSTSLQIGVYGAAGGAGTVLGPDGNHEQGRQSACLRGALVLVEEETGKGVEIKQMQRKTFHCEK